MRVATGYADQLLDTVEHHESPIVMMKTLLSLLVIGTTLAVPGAAGAQDLFFLQMSDPQFGMYTANASFA